MTFTEKLEYMKLLYWEMKTLVNTCENFDKDTTYNSPWEVFSKDFWEMSTRVPFDIEYDSVYGMSHEYAMKTRLISIENFVEGLS